MKSEAELNALVDALRDDLPSAGDEQRMRARLTRLGLALGPAATLTATSMAAAEASSSAGLGVLAKLAALPLATKLGAAALVGGAAVAGPWLWQSERGSQERAVAPSASATTRELRADELSSKERRATRTVADLTSSPVGQVTDEAQVPSALLPALAPVQAALPLPATGGGDRAGGTRASRPVGSGATRATDADSAAANQLAPSTQSAPVTSASPALTSASAEAAFAALPAEARNARPAGAKSSSLSQETVLIDAAFGALRAGNAAQAMRYVREHERRFPLGVLRRERERARALAAPEATP